MHQFTIYASSIKSENVASWDLRTRALECFQSTAKNLNVEQDAIADKPTAFNFTDLHSHLCTATNSNSILLELSS